jgi:hypothetical protein
MARFSYPIPRRISLFAVLLSVAATLRGQAPAIPLPDFQAFTFLNTENSAVFSSAQRFGFGTTSLNAPTDPAGSGGFSMTGTVVGGLDPSVSNSTTEMVLMDPGFQGGTSATSALYYFEVVGPSLTTVPVNILGNITDSWSSNLSTGGGFLDDASLGVYDLDNNLIQGWSVDDQGGTSGGETVAIDQTVNLSTNTAYVVVEDSEAIIQLAYDNAPILDDTYSASVSIDPLITIDPSFDLSGYSLQLSPNLTSSVPDTGNVLGLLAFSSFILAVLLKQQNAGVNEK